MKYGQTLEQRSIPEWGPYNIDYNDIKHLIKDRTSKTVAQPLSIPGAQRQPNDFENELYEVLLEQYQRIDLFVRSKHGEVKRRLVHLHKQIANLIQRTFPSPQAKISVKRLERFSKLEEDALHVGEEIQALSRFVVAQRVAFRKLLKKYEKWTASPSLGKRFRKEVLNRPDGFAQMNFDSILDDWADVLGEVRAPFKGGTASADSEFRRNGVHTSIINSPFYLPPKKEVGKAGDGNLSGERIHAAAEFESDVALDTALATLPIGSAGGRATYWVHEDNLVEMQVLLLQHMRLRTRKTGSPRQVSPMSTPPVSRRGSGDKVNGIRSEDSDATSLVVIDNLERFAKDQNTMTVSEFEGAGGKTLERAVGSVRWCGREAMAVLSPETKGQVNGVSEGSRAGLTANFKRKHVPALFNVEQPLPGRRPSTASTSGDEVIASDRLEQVRDWLSKHSDVRPLVQVSCNRVRFVGLGNGASRGFWATLDRDITMRTASFESLAKEREGAVVGPDAVRFPHAVLEVRWEGGENLTLVHILDNSHLVERARGFSIEIHAIATLYKPKDMPAPYWIPALNSDIRKVPPSKKTGRQRSVSIQVSPPSTHKAGSTTATSVTDGPTSSTSNPRFESSATSVADLNSPVVSAPKKKRRRFPERKNTTLPPPETGERYWNEYDDPEEGSGEEPYTILLDPNAVTTFPGAELFSNFAASIAASGKTSLEKLRSLFGAPKPNEDGAAATNQTPNGGDYFTYRPDADASSEDDSSPLNGTDRFARARRYSTFPPNHRPRGVSSRRHSAVAARERVLFLTYLTSLTAAIVLLVVAGILAATGRRRARLTVDLGVVVSVVAALTFAVTGLGSFMARVVPQTWVHRTVVVGTFAGVCVGSGVLLAAVGSTLEG